METRAIEPRSANVSVERWMEPSPATTFAPAPLQVSGESSLAAYWRILVQRRNALTLVFIVVFGGIAAGTFLQTPIYRAAGLLEIRSENTEVKPVANLFGVDSIPDSSLATQFGVLTSEKLARRVIQELQLDQKPEFNPPLAWWSFGGTQPGDMRPMLTRFSERLFVDPVKGSRLVRVSFDSQDPQLAASTVNSLLSNYIGNRAEETRGTEQWLTKQIDATQEKLRVAEQRLQQFAQANGLQLIEGENGTVQNLLNDRVRRIHEEITLAQADRYGKESLFDAVRKKGRYNWLPTALENPVIQSLTVRLAESRREAAALESTFTSEYPKLQQVKGQIREMEAQLEAERSRAANRVANDYLASVRREDLLVSEAKKLKVQADALSEKGSSYGLLRSELETSRKLYSDLQQKLKDVQVTAALKASDVGIVDLATPPKDANEPKKALNLMLGAMAGLVFGVGFAFLMEHLDSRVKSFEELDHMGVNTLAMIPSAPALRGANGPAVLSFDWWRLPVNSGRFLSESKRQWHRIDRDEAPCSALSEAFGTLRTSFLLQPGGNPPRTLLITGCQPGDGKTTVSVNLAIALARLGRRILLIDADTRKPSVHRAFSLNNAFGLTHYLKGQRQWRSLVQPNLIPGLSVMPAGPLPRDPSALLASPRMKTLLNEAKAEYDFVFLDSPALFINAADARILASMAEGTLAVVRCRATSREALRRALQLAPNLMGVILNDLEIGRLPEYYRSYYADPSPSATSGKQTAGPFVPEKPEMFAS